MKNNHSINKYEEFEDEKDFEGDIEEEYEVEDDNIDNIVNKLQSISSNKLTTIKKEKNINSNDLCQSNKLKQSYIINNNIKEKDYIESNLSNSIISEFSNPKTPKNYSNQPNKLNLEINLVTETNNTNDNNNNKSNQKDLTLIYKMLDRNEKTKNIFDTAYNTSNSSQLDNSEFLLNKLKGNKLLQELKLKQALKNKFSYYGKDINNVIDDKNNNENDKNDNHQNNIVFNIIDSKNNNMKEKLNKSLKKKEKKKKKNINYINRKINQFYFRYAFNCNCKCYCGKLCKRNRRFNTLNIMRNIFLLLVICSAIGFYSMIIFFSK